ncbi:MAG: tRNA (N6-threonylcarbamoyladenosine(37)-N6)-methyltransferase TrmO [Desulfosoma sp.]|uniref:tRNA (N6-threonylcarbamoyladenosine(37)-N6)-methyltransferase TrmO n=1 Tax=Desulfosoma sp. TaxID=2603217 RepID=UPI0040495ACA
MTNILLKPIGIVRTNAPTVPRHWTVSDVEGTIIIDEVYREGLRDIRPGQKIIVLFHFHQSQPFSPENLTQKPPHRNEHLGVFSTCSPRRPNPIGLSVVDVLDIQGSTLRVKGIDMIDGTPILDIKPWIVPDA